jgi:hypothetical protein
LYPPLQECPAGHEAVTERYHKQRWIRQLAQHVKAVSHFLECGHPACERRGALYRPYQEDTWALRGYTCGLDVVVRSGELRDHNNLSITRLRSQLQTESHLSICSKEVAWLGEVFRALVTTVARQDQDLLEQLRAVGSLVLASDGVQPDNSHATLYILRDVCSGRVFVAQTLLSSATSAIELLIDEVRGLGLPIVGVMRDQHESLG